MKGLAYTPLPESKLLNHRSELRPHGEVLQRPHDGTFEPQHVPQMVIISPEPGLLEPHHSGFEDQMDTSVFLTP